MPDTAERPYAVGEALVWTSVEQDMPTRRGVEFQGLSNGGTSALVKWAGGEQFVVPLSALSRAASPNTVPPWLQNWFQVKPPPTPPSELQITERLATARRALAERHQQVQTVQIKLDAARQVVDRATTDVATAQAALRTYDQHQRANQAALEESLRLGKQPPALSNGHDRSYLTDRAAMAEQALSRFQGELATQMEQMGEALAAVRKAAAAILSLLLQRAVEGLRAIERQAAVTRAELLSVASIWPAGAELGALKLPPVTSTYLEMMPAWQDQEAVRSGGPEARQRPWKALYAALVQGDVDADFSLSAGD